MFNHYIQFVVESWGIEGITLSTTDIQRFARYHELWIHRDEVSAETLSDAAMYFTAGFGKLRDKPGMNVRVGNHKPVSGGLGVLNRIEMLCQVSREYDPYELHHMFERLHPFMDGNGRTGRLLWLWSMQKQGDKSWLERGFLHQWYYQSLNAWKPTH